MASTDQLFVSLLRSDNIKKTLFPLISTSDICALRETSSAFCNIVSKHLFTRIHVTFTANTFTKPSRVAALGRIGHHIEHLTFYFPHSEATFLPPLIHPLSGHEISFLYTPHTSMGSVLTRPKYANTELGDILTQQYPPLFHAATNVPSFINAMKLIPNMRHLTIRCPGQDPRERYRRDIVDYALISLRISVERATLSKLNKLSLSSLHPSAFNYLRHIPGFGSVPSSSRRWKQIKKLHISVEAWDFYGPSPGLDHLKVIDDYIRFFAGDLEKLSFTWVGRKGPCPVALSADPLFAPPRSTKKLFHEVTSPMSPLPTRPPRTPIHFPKLRYMQIRNATMNAPQLKELISSHSQTVKEFDFENVVLLNNGNWEEALAPLDQDSMWSRSSLTTASEYSLVTSDSSEDLPSPSAAVEAASRELLDTDINGFNFDDDPFYPIMEQPEGGTEIQEAAMSFTTKLKKKRVRRRRRKHHPEGEAELDEQPSPSPISFWRRPSRPHLKPSVESEVLRSATPVSNHTITAPILISDPQPVLLQPTVYNPAALHRPDEGISPVQRNIEQEEAHRLLAEDAAARISALQKAKAAVLLKLRGEFSARKSRAADAVSACRYMASREFVGGCGNEVIEDRRGLESRSLLVPLMFSRA
ncbi:hypothetical protein HJFPF1_01999 [Paramyrothecium foliicola]|nr:hypothetical protein HJFPF1_01999 [Paramyrothecium foliicola]